VNWFDSTLTVERGIVRQVVDDVKTEYSEKTLSIDTSMIQVLKTWKQTTQFSLETDWIFASPVQLGHLPWSYPHILRVFQSTAVAAGIGSIGTHTMRHTYRSWLDSVGAPLTVQQKLMRHADIRTTINSYGDVVTGEMEAALSKVVRLALGKAN